MRWFRFYDEALEDPKVQRLSPQLFKTWVNLLCLSSKAGGKLPSDDDIAFKLRMSIHDAKQQVEDLILVGLIDVGPKGSRFPHNWSDRQFASDSSAERVRKHRKTKKKLVCNVTCNAEVTPQTQNQIQNTDTESLAHSSTGDAARASEQSFDLKFDKGGGERSALQAIAKRAEGLGVAVGELLEITRRNNPRNPAAYFAALCVKRLRSRFANVPESLIREALQGQQRALQALYQADCAEARP